MAKRISGMDLDMATNLHKQLDKRTTWFYGEVVKSRTEEIINSIVEMDAKIAARNPEDSKKKTIYLSDTCTMLNWEVGEKENNIRRNSVFRMSIDLRGLHKLLPEEANILIYEAAKKALVEDFDNPLDIFLTKKERKRTHKRRKTEKANGTSLAERVGKMPKTEEEKKEARKARAAVRKAKANGSTPEPKAKPITKPATKATPNDTKKAAAKERARIRKEAAKLGITTKEYKEKMDK